MGSAASEGTESGVVEPAGGRRGDPAGAAESSGGSWGSAGTGQPAGNRYWLLVALALAVAWAMRLAFLGADPPWDFTWSQDVFTDGARVVDGARNKLLFGTWITDPRSPVVLFYPISNLIAWVVFKVAGIGLAQANFTGVLPALACVAVMFLMMRRLEGNLGGLVGLVVLGFCHVHVIFSRLPMVESLMTLMLLGSFWLALGGRRDLFLSGALVGLAALMVKLHVLHLVPVVLVFLLIGRRPEGRDRAPRLHLAGSFLAGVGAAVALWLVAFYAGHPAILAKYFKSNVLLSQSSDYSNLGLGQAVTRRIGGLMHVGSGRDGYFVKIPEIAAAAFLGLIGLVSRFSWRRQAMARWETLAGIWFVALAVGLSLLSYRPLRYLTLLTPSVCLLAVSFLLRLARSEPWLSDERPRWFGWAFGIWLTWVMLHFQQDVAFQAMTGGKSIVYESLNDSQKALYRYQFSVFLQLLIWCGAGFLITFFLKTKVLKAPTRLSARDSRWLFLAAMTVVVALNGGRFAAYALDRKYSIAETRESLQRILSDHVFLVGDCANTVALGTTFEGLPAYGDLMRYKERAEFERYPITHFLLRYPALYNYLKETYPDFVPDLKPIRLYGLCGREATLVRFEQWPGYPVSYRPSLFEQGTDLLNDGQSDEAIRTFEAFLDGEPSSYEALWGIAVCQMQKSDDEMAKAYIERALELARTDALSYEVYGDVLDNLGQHELAIRSWNMALEYNPTNKRVMRKMGAAVGGAGEAVEETDQ